MSKVAIVAAMEREVRPLVKHWRASDREHSGASFRFFESGEFVVVCGGIGPEAARRAAEAIIALYSPALIYSVGFAGALDSALKIGDILQPKKVIDAKDASSSILDFGERVLVTFASIANAVQKARLRDSFAAAAVDMEAAAVARAASARGIRFAVVKAISDEADFDFPSMERFIDSKGRFSQARFALFAVLRPWLWLQVFQLARNSERASSSLCAFLRGLNPDHVESDIVAADGNTAPQHRPS
jgi:adenosylhomocysteine nucleosidase